MHFQNRLSSFPKSVQDFLRESDVSNIGTHIEDVDVNSTCTYDSSTVIMMVCMYSHVYDPLRYSYHIPCAVEKVEWLLSKGADPNIQDTVGGWTALMWVARYSSSPERGDSSEKIVKILLEGGADPNIQDTVCGWTALMMAARNSSPKRGRSSEKTVKILLEGGADPNKQDENGYTALMLAAYNSSPERGESSERTVEILLGGGADPDKQDIDGYTALMLAVCNSSPEGGTSSEKTVEILLKAGADPDKQTIHGNTALTLADIPSVKQLIQKLYGTRKHFIYILFENKKLKKQV